MKTKNPESEAEDRFSVPFFVIVTASSLAIIYVAVALIAPDMWNKELHAGWLSLVTTFLLVHLGTAFFEFFFHRYVLHAPIVPFLAYFYKQHTRHHALTSVRPPRADKGVHNEFAILVEEQHEASFFPAYSLIVFALLATPLFMIVHYFIPHVPIFLAGYAALTWSMVLYEILHAFQHKSVEDYWEPLIKHARFGAFWKVIYGFHLRHHADIYSNESISGWFGLPIPDLVFGTWVNPSTLYEHGQKDIDRIEFKAPEPVFFIRWIDTYAKKAIKARRSEK